MDDILACAQQACSQNSACCCFGKTSDKLSRVHDVKKKYVMCCNQVVLLYAYDNIDVYSTAMRLSLIVRAPCGGIISCMFTGLRC